MPPAAPPPSIVTPVQRSGDQRIDGLLAWAKWSAPTLGYSDPDGPLDYPENYYRPSFTGFAQLNPAQLTATHAALSTAPLAQAPGHAGFAVAGFTELDFTYAGAGSGAGTIRLANSFDPEGAYAYLPAEDSHGGDVWFGAIGRDPAPGNFDFATVLHEIGHALGLKHGHEPGVFGALPGAYDSPEFSVMTYRGFVGGAVDTFTAEYWGQPQSFMALDIAALQYLYGADFETNAGDTVYGWDPLTGCSYVDGRLAIPPGANRILQTVWDGGGVDTYDLSEYGEDLRLNLAPGAHSTFSKAQCAYLGGGPNDGFARGNVFNALQFQGDPRSLIENALGGAGDDTVLGNATRNHLVGDAGADTLRGRHGNDVLDGGRGPDVIRGGAGNDLVLGGGGADVLIGGTGFDTFRFGAAESLVGRGRRDVVEGAHGRPAFEAPDAGRGDRIDVSAIDAIAASPGDDAFRFASEPGTGRIWAEDLGARTLIRASTDADASPEFELEIRDGAVLASAYTEQDFIL